MLEINERKIQITGKANIPVDLKESSEYDLTIGCVETDGSSSKPNQDGTKDVTFKLKISEKSEINIISEKSVIKAVKKGSQSKLQRYLIQQLAEKYDEEPEAYYIKRMTANIDRLKTELE